VPVTLAAPPSQTPTAPARPSPGSELLARIAGEVQVLPQGVTVAGAPLALPGSHSGAPGLHAALTDALLDRYFLGGAGRPAWSDPALVRRVGALLGHRCCWEGGWRVVGSWARGWLAQRDGLVLPVDDDEVRFGTDGVRVRFPAERPQSSGGWLVLAGTAGPAPRTGRLAECSLHLVPATAPGLLAGLVGRLDGLRLPFTARLLTDPTVTGRPDAAVVTAARADLPAVVLAALGLHGGARAGFGDAVPGFTRALAPGVAVADLPAPGPGFGRHRCGLAAAGLLAAGPGAGDAQRLAAVRAAFTAAGLDPGAPHLGPGEADLALSCW
jgi:HopA1 effector protein family